MTFRSERHGQTALWILDRPTARNAITHELAEALSAALDELEHDLSVRALVLTGEGEKAFSAGADLKFLRTGSVDARAAFNTRMREVVERLSALRLPVIAALNGVALGGGAELALAADMRIAEPHASLAFKHAAMGVTPGWGGLGRLCALVGRGTASKLLFTSQPLSATDALGAGLVDELVERGAARMRSLQLGADIAVTSPAAVADLKRLLALAYEHGPAVRTEERRTFAERAQHGDHAEALAAVAEGRPARFAPLLPARAQARSRLR
jgi:enoyl-CoA hydratase/carnithine racemase